MDEVKNYFLEKLKKEQAAAEDAQNELSQYGGLMDIGRGLTFNVKNVESPDAFIKQQQELAGQGSKNVIDQQKVEKTAADQVRESLLANLQQAKVGNDIQDQLTRQQLERDKFGASSQLDADKLELAKRKVLFDAGNDITLADLKRRQLEQEAKATAAKAEKPQMLKADEQFISSLSTKNANKVAIKNQIDAVMQYWDALSPTDKLTQGRMLLKTLNSPEGADAIGVEESRRIGEKLEFAMGNLFSDNPVRFGRDLEGFKRQSQQVAQSIGNSVASNEKAIQEAYRKSGQEYTPTFVAQTEVPGTKLAKKSLLSPEKQRRRAEILSRQGK